MHALSDETEACVHRFRVASRATGKRPRNRSQRAPGESMAALRALVAALALINAGADNSEDERWQSDTDRQKVVHRCADGQAAPRRADASVIQLLSTQVRTINGTTDQRLTQSHTRHCHPAHHRNSILHSSRAEPDDDTRCFALELAAADEMSANRGGRLRRKGTSSRRPG
jgi:hypothetical protein